MNRPLRVSVVPCLFAEPRLSKYRDIESEWIRLTSWNSNETSCLRARIRDFSILYSEAVEKINSR